MNIESTFTHKQYRIDSLIMSSDQNEIESDETRTDRRIQKGIEKLEKTITYKNRNRAIIVADSKGRELWKQRDSNTHVSITYQPGAKLRNAHLDATIKRHLNNRTIKNPIVLIWLGTCELTIKTRKGFTLQPNIGDYVNTLISEYQTYKDELLLINPNLTILFLECPYFKLHTFNLAKKYVNSKITFAEQKTLEKAIIAYNNSLISLNRISTPIISEDLVKYGKGKIRRQIQKNIDYRQLNDGCHPCARLWHKTMADQIC